MTSAQLPSLASSLRQPKWPAHDRRPSKENKVPHEESGPNLMTLHQALLGCGREISELLTIDLVISRDMDPI